MSHSPDELSTSGQLLQYDRGWSALNKLIRSGRSFSGRERNCCFLNLGDGKSFANISAASGLDMIHDGRAVAMSDWDADGDVDLWIASRTGPRVRYLRNDMLENPSSFVAIRLEGVNCNRDAIGARVSLYRNAGDQQPLLRTLQAGHGYLTQSTKWIHFGLGDAKTVDRITIQWPGSDDVQTISGLEPNRWYRVRQGDPPQIELQPPAKQVHQPSVPKENSSTDRSRTVLLEPVPLPELTYSTVDGKPVSVSSMPKRPRLLNVWATWCTPCLTEMKEWAAAKDKLDNVEIDILSLCVDEPTDDSAADRERARLATKQLAYPYSIGLPTGKTVPTLDIVQRTFIGKQRPLPVPASFLIDREGRLAVIYRGSVSADQLLKDVALLDASSEDILHGAVPFDGKWLTIPDATPPSTLARAQIDSGDFLAAREYLVQLIDRFRTQLATSSGTEQARIKSALAMAYETVGRLLLDAKEPQKAVAALESSLGFVAKRRSVLLELVHAHTHLNQPAKAAEQLEALLELRPDDPELLVQLARIRASQRNYSEAIRLAQSAAQIKPTSAHRALLGRMLLIAGDLEAAVAELSAAVELRPKWSTPANDLAWVLATSPKESIRNGERAVALAELAVDRSQRQHIGYLDTLAAAYAETGAFERAVSAIDEAIQLAKPREDATLTNKLTTRRNLYARRQPYRDAAL